MQTISQTITGRIELGMQGSSFRIMRTTSLLTIEFYRSGQLLSKAEGMAAGLSVSDFPFDRVAITPEEESADIQVAYSTGKMGMDRIAGEVDISNCAGPFANSQKTVTNASTQLLAANAARRYLLVQNNGAGTVYLAFGKAATVADGVKLLPGASYELANYCSSSEVRAIGDIASNTAVIVVEG